MHAVRIMPDSDEPQEPPERADTIYHDAPKDVPPWAWHLFLEELRFYSARTSAQDDVDVPVILCGYGPQSYAT